MKWLCFLAVFLLAAPAGCSRRAEAPGDEDAPAAHDIAEARDEIVIGVDRLPCPDEFSLPPAAQEEREEMPVETEPEEKEEPPAAAEEVEPVKPEPPPPDPREQLNRMGILYHRWAFIEAAGAGNTEAVELFIQAGMDVNVINSSVYGETALMWAARGGHAETVQALIENGAEVNSRNSKGMTALGYAAMFGHRESSSLLREAGAVR